MIKALPTKAALGPAVTRRRPVHLSLCCSALSGQLERGIYWVESFPGRATPWRQSVAEVRPAMLMMMVIVMVMVMMQNLSVTLWANSVGLSL